MKNKAPNLERENHVVMKVAQQFAAQQKDVKIYNDDGSLDKHEFFFNYFKIYKTTQELIPQNSDRKVFFFAMDNYFVEYFIQQFKDRLLKGEARQAIINSIKGEAQAYLPP